MMSGVGALLAASTVLAARPRATDSQVSAKANRIKIAAAASQFAALVVARKPVSSAIAVTATMPSTVWITAAADVAGQHGDPRDRHRAEPGR